MTRRVMLMISSMRGGGSERQTLQLLKRLDRSRLTPSLYLIHRAGDLLQHVPADVEVHCFHDQPSEGGLYFPGRALRQQTQHVGEIIRDNRIDVVYDRTFHMTMIADPACRSTSTPRVSTIVSPPHHALPRVESRLVGLKRRRLAKAYRRSRYVIAVSQQAAQSACRYYHLPENHVRVIRNPIDPTETRALAAAETIARDDRMTLVCVGRMTEEKGHRNLIEAISRLETSSANQPPIRLWLVGDGPLRGELQSQWDWISTGIHSIEFLGTQPNAAPYIDAADALILPSLFEGMPNAVLEAMALETPVIATRAGGTVELEADAPTILWAEPGKPASLANAIEQFTQDRNGATERTKAATELLLAQHDSNRITQTIEDLLLQA